MEEQDFIVVFSRDSSGNVLSAELDGIISIGVAYLDWVEILNWEVESKIINISLIEGNLFHFHVINVF